MTDTGTAPLQQQETADQQQQETAQEVQEAPRKRGRPRKEIVALAPIGDPEVHAKIGLLELALRSNANIDVIERMVALQERAQAKLAEAEFNTALSRAQARIGRIAPDSTNPVTHSRFASLAAIDREVRPVYTEEGFSLTFDTGQYISETVEVFCFASKGSYTRSYKVVIPADGKGPQGAAVMSKTHATGSALSYGQRYLLKLIFNLAIGDDDDDGNAAGAPQAQAAAPLAPDHSQFLKEAINSINQAENLEPDLKTRWQTARKMALNLNDQTLVDAIDRAKEGKKEALLAANKRN